MGLPTYFYNTLHHQYEISNCLDKFVGKKKFLIIFTAVFGEFHLLANIPLYFLHHGTENLHVTFKLSRDILCSYYIYKNKIDFGWFSVLLYVDFNHRVKNFTLCFSWFGCSLELWNRHLLSACCVVIDIYIGPKYRFVVNSAKITLLLRSSEFGEKSFRKPVFRINLFYIKTC